MPAPLLAVDAPSLLYRAWFALPDSIADGDGHPVNALLGATNAILRVVADRAPRAVVICSGAEALRRAAGAGARLHRAARRSVRRAAGRERDRGEDRRGSAPAARIAGGGARETDRRDPARAGRTARPGRRAARLPRDRDLAA